MAKFKYKGVNHSEDVTTLGLVFRVGGEDLEPETDDKKVIAKLRGNSCFEELEEGPKDPCDHISSDFNGTTAEAYIETITTLDELNRFAGEDTRVGVSKAADKKALELQPAE